MSKKITSVANTHIKQCVALRKAQVRKKQGVTLVDGIKELNHAVKGGVRIEEIYVLNAKARGLAPLIKKAQSVFEITEAVYEKIAYGARGDGVVAIVRPKIYSLNNLNLNQDALCIVLENVEKPGNLGAILRTVDAAGAHCVFVCDQQTDIFNPNVVRASLGTVFTTKVISISSDELIDYLKAHKVSVCATTPDAAQVYHEADLSGAKAIVMGEEHKGLTDKWLKAADVKVSIPMGGTVDSLNVSVSTAVILYEAVRQRG